MKSKSDRSADQVRAGRGLAVGIALGTALGAAFSKVGLGIALGVAIGAAIDSRRAQGPSSDLS